MSFQQGNLLLEQLPTEDVQRLLPYLQLVSLEKIKWCSRKTHRSVTSISR